MRWTAYDTVNMNSCMQKVIWWTSLWNSEVIKVDNDEVENDEVSLMMHATHYDDMTMMHT